MSSISNRRLSTRELTMTALFVTLITAGAFIRVPLPNCPFTLQILFTTLAGIISVSYTHLDVYKRQKECHRSRRMVETRTEGNKGIIPWSSGTSRL